MQVKDERGSGMVDLTIDRRSVLATLGGVATVGLLRLVQGGSLAYALTSEEHAKFTPDEIIARAKKGNERFLSGKRKGRDLLREQKNMAKGRACSAPSSTSLRENAHRRLLRAQQCSSRCGYLV